MQKKAWLRLSSAALLTFVANDDVDSTQPAAPALLRLRQYTFDAMRLGSVGPPWHRGLVALGAVLGAIVIGRSFAAADAVAVAPALAVFMTLADTEGPLQLRLSTLFLTVSGMLLGGVLTLWLGIDSMVLDVLLILLTACAGLGAMVGPPFQQATRFCVVIALLITVTHGIDLLTFLGVLASTATLVALCRYAENLIAPDVTVGAFKSLKEAVFALRSARAHIARFLICYVLAAVAGWIMGRSLDRVHPTWVTVTVLVVMWPDAQRSYLRIFQRVAGTLIGAAVALVLIGFVKDVRLLGVIAGALLFFLPHFIRRNYWMHSGLMVVFIMVSLDLWSGQRFTPALVLARVGDVLIGCAVALLGTLGAFASLQARVAKAGDGSSAAPPQRSP